MDEVSYDFEVLGPSEKDPETNDVLLVATRTENVEQRQAAVKAAGLTAKIVDVEAFALENACKLMTHQMPDGGIDRTIAVVDFGASSTTFSVLRNLKVVYTRDFAFGGQQLTEEIMRTYGLSMEEAGRAKKEGGLPGNYQSEVLDPFIDDMTQQVSRSLQFYLASGSGREQPEKILVCGGCANIPGVADVISEPRGYLGREGRPARTDETFFARQGTGRAARCDGSPDRLRSRPAELRLDMPRINLLPWREEERKERKLAFVVAIMWRDGRVAAVVAFAGYLLLNSMIDGQDQRNERLKAGDPAARQADRGDQQPRELEAEVHRPHGNHREAAALAPGDRAPLRRDRATASGRRVSHLGEADGQAVCSFDGVAQSSTRVSAFMRNIDGSEWMRNPDLEVVAVRRRGGSELHAVRRAGEHRAE